uniref:Uncharacterized protein n=1 Tax=Oryza glaberrima TaxID=4538 RepID=I1P745_ORYGL
LPAGRSGGTDSAGSFPRPDPAVAGGGSDGDDGAGGFPRPDPAAATASRGGSDGDDGGGGCHSYDILGKLPSSPGRDGRRRPRGNRCRCRSELDSPPPSKLLPTH